MAHGETEESPGKQKAKDLTGPLLNYANPFKQIPIVLQLRETVQRV